MNEIAVEKDGGDEPPNLSLSNLDEEGPRMVCFGGVLAAMAGFIWVRKRRAPWEGYAVDNATLNLLGIFIFGLLAVQIVVFILQILHIVSFELPFANTAHVSGVFLGMGLGYMEWMKGK